MVGVYSGTDGRVSEQPGIYPPPHRADTHRHSRQNMGTLPGLGGKWVIGGGGLWYSCVRERRLFAERGWISRCFGLNFLQQTG